MSREERFDGIYRSHSAAVLAYARRRAPRDVAEEIAAETFLVCWRRLDAVPDDALPWLYGVARRTLANSRRTGAQATTTLGPEIADPTVAERDPTLALAFARVSQPDRELLALVAWEGLSLREAAVVLGCTAVACRVRFHRAKRRLAQHLEALDDMPSRSRFRSARTEGAAR
jgi:RNA polymerase sigma-70 factor (ECF subfamily)